MDRQTILLISDMRQVYLAEILTKKGHNVRCLDIRNRETALQQLEKLKRFLDKADVLILPIPVQKVPEQEIFYDILNKNLEKKTLVMGGCFSTEQRELLTGRDIHFLDAIRENGLDADIIYACGPTPMLRAIKEYAAEQNIECWISMEERMACGIGACLACVCKSKEKDAHSNVNNKRICKDGPVFLSTEVDL